MESRAGFANRFLVGGPFTNRMHRRIRDLAPLMQTLSQLDVQWRAQAFDGPIVELAPFERLGNKDPIPFWLLRARVWSSALQDVALETGGTGKIDLFLAGERVHQVDSKDRTLRAHRRVVATFDQGWNDITVRLEKMSPNGVSFSLRVRRLDGQPVAGLRWALPQGAGPGAGLCDAVDLALTQRATEDGWTLAASARAEGLLPQRAETRWAIAVDGAPAPLAEGPLAMAALATEARTLEATLPAAGAEATVALIVDGERCRERTILHRDTLRRRLLSAEAAVAEVATGLAEGTRASLAYHATRTRALLEDNDPREALVAEDVAALEQLLATARSGRDPYEALGGVVTRAYRSAYDGSLRRYVVLVPPSYLRRPNARFPVVVAAHGLLYSPEDMARIISGTPSRPGRALSKASRQFAFPDHGALVVAHDGYGDAGHRPPGEVDILRVIAEVKAAYRVDPDRVSLTGFSLGGSVGFWVPLHSPDLFSAAAPLCGYPNLSEYGRVRWQHKRPWEEVIIDHDSPARFADNGRYLPLRIVHGERDRPERSKVVVDRYRALSYRVDFEIPKGRGHHIWDDAYQDGTLVRWLARQRRPSTAGRPVLKTARYRWNKAYWLRLDRFARWGAFGELRGRLDKRRRRIIVDTDNVSAFTIVASGLEAIRDDRRELVVDGQGLGTVGLDADLFLGRGDDGRWRLTDLVDVPADHKRPGLEGPLRDLWYEPFVVVYGTQDPLQTEANRMTAQAVSRYSPWIDLAAPVFADTELQPHELAGRHVVLVGNPASNLHTRAAVARGLPVTFEADALVFDGHRYEGEDVGISTILPSPFDEDRYLVLHAGVGAQGTLSARFLPEWAPDYLVYDSRIRARWWDYVLGPREVLAGGFYDEAWQVP
ncbi:MAG: hypothetical protein CSA66_06935 [Proteobacteria bacterium]|nr:MAG: hypothetical protein CSA66_06935 [Pseudomonadota bacterium]